MGSYFNEKYSLRYSSGVTLSVVGTGVGVETCEAVAIMREVVPVIGRTVRGVVVDG
jgi:hypothetical protein